MIRLLARPMLASSFVVSGVDKLRHADQTAAELSPVLRQIVAALPVQTDEKTVARVLAGTQVGAGLLLAAGKFSRLSATLLSVTAALTTYVEYKTAHDGSKESKAHRRSQLTKNVGLLGGALLASVDTAGRPGLAWRAGHAFDAGRRNAEHVVASSKKATKRQLKQANKGVRSLAHDVTGQ